MKINFLFRLGQNFNPAITHRLQRRGDDFVRVNKPLIGQHRLNHHFGAVAERLHDGFILHQGHQLGGLLPLCIGEGVLGHHRQTFAGDVIDNFLARLKTIHAAIGIRHHIHGGNFCLVKALFAIGDALGGGRLLRIGLSIRPQIGLCVHQIIHRNAGAFGDLIVVEIMRPGDFDRARPKVFVGVLIGDDGNQAPLRFGPDGNFTHHPDNRRIALVGGMHRNRTVAQHGLWAGGGDGDIVALFLQRDLAVFIFLHIGICRAAR